MYMYIYIYICFSLSIYIWFSCYLERERYRERCIYTYITYTCVVLGRLYVYTIGIAKHKPMCVNITCIRARLHQTLHSRWAIQCVRHANNCRTAAHINKSYQRNHTHDHVASWQPLYAQTLYDANEATIQSKMHINIRVWLCPSLMNIHLMRL